MHQHQGKIRWRDTADAAGLAEGAGLHSRQLLACLSAEVPHARVVKALGDQPFGMLPLLLDPLSLKRKIPLVADIGDDLPRHVG